MDKKKFPVGDLLSITTGRLVSPSGIEGIYNILSHMTDESVYTHQLPRFANECKPYLLRQFPELAKAGTVKNLAKLDTLVEDSAHHSDDSPATAAAMWVKWISESGICNLKTEYEVSPIPHEAHQHKNPIEELTEMVDPDRIVVLQMSE